MDIIISESKCMARKNQKNDIHCQCPNKRLIGDFCGKHRNYTQKGYIRIDEPLPLCIKITNHKNVFTNNESILKDKNRKIPKSKEIINLTDYIIGLDINSLSSVAIKKTIIKNKIIPKKDIQKYNKEQLLDLVKNIFQSYLIGLINIEKVIKIQKYYKLWVQNNKKRLQGPGIYNRLLCNNTTDFNTFDNLVDIPEKYFFSFKDDDHFIYGFHIESFIYLINNTRHTKNPYNRRTIPENVKEKARIIWNELIKKEETSNEINQEESTDIKVRVRNNIIKTFQKIDIYGYQTDINWILNVSSIKIKNIYKSLLNLWHHKANLSNNVKRNIYPDGNPFLGLNVLELNNIRKYEIYERIIKIFNNFISYGTTEDNKNNGCILILMSIGENIRECRQSNSWLQ